LVGCVARLVERYRQCPLFFAIRDAGGVIRLRLDPINEEDDVMKKTIVLGLAAAAALAAGTAQAAPRTRMVNIGDLDLSTKAGQSKFNRRVERAAQDVCSVDFTGSIRDHVASRDCRRTARADAQAQVSLKGQVRVASR
jgi:UrcA family protein